MQRAFLVPGSVCRGEEVQVSGFDAYGGGAEGEDLEDVSGGSEGEEYVL